ncbi:MAG: major capsid protein [Hyphomicrobiales bacterium]|nr:major capsid protein [Hyphomicrobiales bacterium]
MAAGFASDFKVYQEYLKTRATETLVQQADVFNAASNNSIILTTAEKPGDYEYESFFKNVTSLVTRRDTTSGAAATILPMTQDEFVRVKLNRKIGPVDQTRDAFRKIFARYSEIEFSGILGQQIAVAQQLDMVNAGLLSARAALVNVSSGALQYTVPSSGTLTTNGLINGLALFGDRADRVVAWVMHSKQYYDLVLDQVAANVDGVSNFNIRTGTPVTLNRPVIVTDSASLTTISPTQYHCLGLVNNSVLCEVSETNDIVLDEVTGLDNLQVRLQGEFAYNNGLKGFQWDVTNGGVNPDDTALGTGTNWDSVMDDDKDLAGVVITSA